MHRPIRTSPMHRAPTWAVLQRRLFEVVEAAARQFSERYCEPDGRLRFSGTLEDRDGVDDFYEPFFNWPAFYALGGSADVLRAAKRHWEGVTTQLTEHGMLTEEFENGYDWFHQGESLLFFYGLCAADPADAAFAERAHRFARLYTDPAHGNYDPAHAIIRAPHNGALGPRPGLGPQWQGYSADQEEMAVYGLPLHDVDGIHSWQDLAEPANAAAMGQAMHQRAAGDVPVNLAATSLVANAWLYDGDPAGADWIAEYVQGWRARAANNGGLLPDNVAPDGRVGGLHGGRFYGGHYGWTWPHGLHSVGMSALVGGLNAALVTGDDSFLDVSRIMLDTVLAEAIVAPPSSTPFSLRQFSAARYGDAVHQPSLLVPHRYGRDGWFDYGPMQLELPLWLWWWSRDPADYDRVQRVLDGMPEMTEPVQAFRDKMEAGHDAPWLAFLSGDLPDYPERALSMALGQVARRVALMEAEHPDPSTVHLHFWQRVNPVVTEILSQLVTGTPQTLYNGGLPFAAVSYSDADRGRPGLPPDVAALVRRLDGGQIDLELVNLSLSRTRRVWVRPSRFGEQQLSAVTVRAEEGGTYPGPSTAAAADPGKTVATEHPGGAAVLVELAPHHRTELTLHTAPSGAPARHLSRPRY